MTRLRLSIPAALFGLLFSILAVPASPQETHPGELAWSIKYDPKTLDPAKADEQVSGLVRYLTGGVLLRVNRQTQQAEPSLAESWKLSADGRTAVFRLRKGLVFSDGSPLTAKDVAFSIERVLSPETGAPVLEELPSGVRVESPEPLTVVVHLPRRVVGLDRIFDEIAIEPANRPSQARVTSGSYIVSEYKRGQSIRLTRNPHYYRHDRSGAQLPYLTSLRLDILANPEQDQASFVRGEHQLLTGLPPDYYNLLARTEPQAVRDLGPSLNTEQLWFNQSPASPLPAWEKRWFQSQAFRTAISQAIHRADLARIAYQGHATPAFSFISPANRTWYAADLHPPSEDPAAAAELLRKAGFRRAGPLVGPGAPLSDVDGHLVRFSILTNAGNRGRERMATLIQQDLAALGIEVRVVTLDFPALIERLMHTLDYQACLLGLTNVDPDPNAMMNLWLSSSPNHQWNPSEKAPATAWEAAIDAEMQAQATAATLKERKRAVDHVQQIVLEQQPFIYLVHPNTLYAISPRLGGVDLATLDPGAVWNIDTLFWKGSR